MSQTEPITVPLNCQFVDTFWMNNKNFKQNSKQFLSKYSSRLSFYNK